MVKGGDGDGLDVLGNQLGLPAHVIAAGRRNQRTGEQQDRGETRDSVIRFAAPRPRRFRRPAADCRPPARTNRHRAGCGPERWRPRRYRPGPPGRRCWALRPRWPRTSIEPAARAASTASTPGLPIQTPPRRRKAVAVKYRRLHQAQRGHGRALALSGQGQQSGQVALDAQFGLFQRQGGFFAVSGQQVEAELRVEDGLGKSFERKQADGLLLQFLHAARRRARWQARRSGSPMRRMGSWACRRRRNSASAMAAGWAMTWTARS